MAPRRRQGKRNWDAGRSPFPSKKKNVHREVLVSRCEGADDLEENSRKTSGSTKGNL